MKPEIHDALWRVINQTKELENLCAECNKLNDTTVVLSVSTDHIHICSKIFSDIAKSLSKKEQVTVSYGDECCHTSLQLDNGIKLVAIFS